MNSIIKKLLLLQLFFLFFLTAKLNLVFADGVQLSSTQIGTTARFTAQIPADPCGIHKTGETKTRTVVSFAIDIHPIDDDGVVRTAFGKPKRADLSEAQIVEVIIAGKKVTDFYEDPDRLRVQNIADFLPMQRDFKLNTPITFTPNDTASIVVDNVKILEAGRVTTWFGLIEPNGIYCLSSKYTILTLGSNTAAVPPATIQKKAIIEPSKIVSTVTLPQISPTTQVVQKVVKKNEIKKANEKELSPLQSLFRWITSLFSKN